MSFRYVITFILIIASTSIYYCILHLGILRKEKIKYLEINQKHNSNYIINFYNNYNSLPNYIKNFEDLDANYSNLCENYWEKSVKYAISRYKKNEELQGNVTEYGPTIQSDQALKYIFDTKVANKNTLIKLRLKIGFNKNYDYYIFPYIYCIKDERIKLNKIKLRDINHTIRYINKAIKYINDNNNSSDDNNWNEMRYLDLLIHYDDCPLIWNSMPFNLYQNDSNEYEKCILNSNLSKEIQYFFTNKTNIYLQNEDDIFLNNENIIYNNFVYYIDINNNRIKSKIIDNEKSSNYICNSINSYINEVISYINSEKRKEYCYGTIECYLPCYQNEDNKILLSINKKLKKNDPRKIFNSLHCICRINIPKGLVFSISSHYNSWDFASIPYVNHLDSNEIIARTLLNENNTSWNLKDDILFFIGRYTDTFRLDLSCNLYNLLKNKFEINVFISDSNKISCEKRAKFLENQTNCDSSFICRNNSVSFNEWIELLSKSRISLDLSGVGPWSNRLRILLLFGKFKLLNLIRNL